MTLTERIYFDLSRRLESDAGLPCKLTFSALSQHYEVSLTPVRRAVKELLADGYLESLDNGRLRVSDAIPKKRRHQDEPQPPPQDLEAVIRSDLIQRSLAGDSNYIREDAAAAKYNVGRTVLRPIFGRLTGQGLLQHFPRQGWRVRPFDKKDLCDFIIVRETLELCALEHARPNLDKDVLKELLEENRNVAEINVGALNNNLHSYWINLSGNHYIVDFFNRQALYYTSLFHFAAPEAHIIVEMAQQHCEILEALIEDRWTLAKKSLVKHIRDQKPAVVKLIDEFRSRAPKEAV